MRVLIFFTTLVCNISHSVKNEGRCDQKRILVFMYSTPYSCPILLKLDTFSKNTQIPDFIKIRSVGAELFHADGQTDGQS